MKVSLCLLLTLALTGPALAAVDPATVSLDHLAQKSYDGRDLTLGKVLATNGAYTRYYITYKSGELTISGIMNVPKGAGPFPVIITNHGYINTKVYTNGRGLKREQDYLARNGFAVLHPDYRNHNGSSRDPDNDLRLYTGYTEDVINAVQAVRNSDIKFLDKNKIGMLGHSLGGGIALSIMAVKPGLIKAYVLFAPTSLDYRDNFYRWIAPPGRQVAQKFGPPATRHKIIDAYGTPDSKPDFWNGLSVSKHLQNITEPVMVHQGTADDSVPQAWSEKLEKTFRSAGQEITLYIYPGEKHEFSNAWPRVMKRSVEFFKSKLELPNRAF